MINRILTVITLLFWGVSCNYPYLHAQEKASDKVADTSKMKYIYSMEEAQKLSYQKKRPIFINCYAKWAMPCIGMDKYVFSDQKFADYMNKTFINLFIDMKSPEGKELSKEYNVHSYAHYLILNYKGEIIQRISGGGKLPEFKEKVHIALSPKTSLKGTREKYETGKYSKKELYNYLKALNIAGEDSTFLKLGKEYMAMLSDKEYSEKKNWMFARLYRDRKNLYYRYLIANKPSFVKENGERAVNNYLSSLFASEVLNLATEDAEYDSTRMNKLAHEIKEAGLPDTCLVSVVYSIGKLRGQKKYHELLLYMEKNGRYFSQQPEVRPLIEASFNFPNVKGDEKAELLTYLQKAANRETGTNATRLKKLIVLIEKGYKGIKFEKLSFAQLMKKAKEQNKLVFIDCYTSWCGPCRSMANSVFPKEEIGNYFNAHFINTKMDMEKGEGKEIAKKYKINAFPTLLFLDPDGNLIERLIGYKAPAVLLDAAYGVKSKPKVTHLPN